MLGAVFCVVVDGLLVSVLSSGVFDDDPDLTVDVDGLPDVPLEPLPLVFAGVPVVKVLVRVCPDGPVTSRITEPVLESTDVVAVRFMVLPPGPVTDPELVTLPSLLCTVEPV
jgi:hypothetical protein